MKALCADTQWCEVIYVTRRLVLFLYAPVTLMLPYSAMYSLLHSTLPSLERLRGLADAVEDLPLIGGKVGSVDTQHDLAVMLEYQRHCFTSCLW